MMNNTRIKLKELFSRIFVIRLMISIGILSLAVLLFRQGDYWKVCGLILGIPAIVIISKQIIEIIIVLADIISVEFSIYKFRKLINKKIIVIVTTLFIGLATIIGLLAFVGMIITDFKNQLAHKAYLEKWEKEEQEQAFYDSHNHIRDDLKKVYLSYLAGHPEDISDSFQFKNNLNTREDQISQNFNVAFNYLSLDTVTQFDVSKKEDEFKYKDYLTQISSTSKLIVSNEIKQSSNIYKKEIPVTIFSKTYDFNTKSFNFYSMSIKYNDMNMLPSVCTISTINQSAANKKLILNDAEQESYRYSEDLGGDFGKYCYKPNGLENLSPGAPYIPPSGEKSDNGIVIKVGSDLPPIYLDLSDLYAFGEAAKKNGIYIPDEAQARNISGQTESQYIRGFNSNVEIPVHKINGMITVSFSPASDCKISHVCILDSDKRQNLYPWDDVTRLCDMKKVMICKPTFSNFRLQAYTTPN
jgi:hypothetical protein